MFGWVSYVYMFVFMIHFRLLDSVILLLCFFFFLYFSSKCTLALTGLCAHLCAHTTQFLCESTVNCSHTASFRLFGKVYTYIFFLLCFCSLLRQQFIIIDHFNTFESDYVFILRILIICFCLSVSVSVFSTRSYGKFFSPLSTRDY